MDIIRGTQQRPYVPPRAEAPHAHAPGGWRRLRLWHKIAILVIVTAGIVAIHIVPKADVAQQIDSSKYQVVYLANGQAYFGKLQNTNGPFMVIKTPYTAQGVNSTDNESKAATTTLLKVSAQVYGPEDSIAIRTDQVTFWQNLRDDSKIAQALTAKQ